MATNDDLAWLKQEISRGLMGLVVLHLEGGPGAETVGKTAEVWFLILKSWPIAWNEALDRPRLSAGFVALASRSRRWPSPSELRLMLPERVYPQPALPEPEYPIQKQRRNQAALKQIRLLAEQRAERLKALTVCLPEERRAITDEIADIEAAQRKLYS